MVEREKNYVRMSETYRENKNTSELDRTLRIPRSTIRSIVKKFEETGHVENQQGRGRKRTFTDSNKKNFRA